jgi:hypothetical protein
VNLKLSQQILLVQGVGVEPTMGKIPADFKPAAYANFASPAPANAARKEYHALRCFLYSVALSSDEGSLCAGYTSTRSA